jgi:Flp pilus assembly protein TadD
LLQESRQYAAAGEYAAAAASLERAVRIEPADPWLWIELAKVHLASGNLPQAESHARKALTLAGQDPAAREAAEDLLNAIASR